LDLSKSKISEISDLLHLIALSTQHKMTKKSFVIVTDLVDIDKVPEELAVAPSLQEAYDVIEMEDIERDLGF
ncbi:MAG: ribonuclease Z, partial [Psychroflexus sp.]|nr:ribonuclease Z [Psychroflexus sp.]MDN6311084.1 ribonuclease Z [Psychroflexus sp.]